VIYRPEIDGLRALAVVSVILFHAGLQIFSGGYIGVDIFFVISGYLITTIILTEISAGNFSLVHFYERRARRILPALFLVMAICIPFAWAWLSPSDMKAFSKSLRDVPLFFSNVLFYRESGYFNTDAELKPLLHTWSLAVEEQYYIGFPLVLLAIWKYARRFVPYILFAIAIFSLFYAERMLKLDPDAAFFLLPSRIWELMIGALLAYGVVNHFLNVRTNEIVSLLGISLILVAIFTFDKNMSFPGLYALVPTVGAAMIILSATQETLVGRVLRSRCFVGVGLISYSAYLWHQPIFAFSRQQSLGQLDGSYQIALIVMTFVLAYLSWRFVEQPFRNRNLIKRRNVVVFALVGSLSLITIGVVGRSTNGFEQRVPSEILAPINKALESKEIRSKCWNQLVENPVISKTCNIGRSDGQPTFALLGDSHAGSLEPALHKISLELGKSGKNLTYVACQSIPISKVKSDQEKSICERFRENIYSSLDTDLIPEVIIFSSRYAQVIEAVSFDNGEGGIENDIQGFSKIKENNQTTISRRMESYTQAIKTLLDSGRKVVLVYPIPEMGWNVPKRMLRLYAMNGEIKKEDASTDYEVFQKRNRNAYLALDNVGEHENLIRIYPENFYCNTVLSGRCIAHIDGNPIFYDDDHLTEFGAELMVKQIAQVLSWRN
jgi:peptidoglycan/LPS O-acetylase OafA/YrhL